MNEYDKAVARAEGEVVKVAVALVRQNLEGDVIEDGLLAEDRQVMVSYWRDLKRAVNEFWEVGLCPTPDCRHE